MQQSQADPEVRLTDAARARAAAEHGEWAEMLTYSDRLTAEYAQTPEYFHRQAQLRSIALEIAVAMRLSEGQVHRRLSCARTVRDQAPAVWSALAAGTVDAYRVTMIADTITKLHRPASITKLDAKVIGYATTHTSIELRGWLKRFVVRVEADLFNERAGAERADRPGSAPTCPHTSPPRSTNASPSRPRSSPTTPAPSPNAAPTSSPRG